MLLSSPGGASIEQTVSSDGGGVVPVDISNAAVADVSVCTSSRCERALDSTCPAQHAIRLRLGGRRVHLFQICLLVCTFMFLKNMLILFLNSVIKIICCLPTLEVV